MTATNDTGVYLFQDVYAYSFSPVTVHTDT